MNVSFQLNNRSVVHPPTSIKVLIDINYRFPHQNWSKSHNWTVPNNSIICHAHFQMIIDPRCDGFISIRRIGPARCRLTFQFRRPFLLLLSRLMLTRIRGVDAVVDCFLSTDADLIRRGSMDTIRLRSGTDLLDASLCYHWTASVRISQHDLCKNQSFLINFTSSQCLIKHRTTSLKFKHFII